MCDVCDLGKAIGLNASFSHYVESDEISVRSLLKLVCNAENMGAVHFLYICRRYTIPHPLSQRGLVREGSHDELVGNLQYLNKSDIGFC